MTFTEQNESAKKFETQLYSTTRSEVWIVFMVTYTIHGVVRTVPYLEKNFK